MDYTGRCHCGAVSFRFTGPEIVDGLRCNCSICLKKGALMSNFFISPEALQIEAEEGAIASYQFATHVAAHHFCKTCGIYTFHQTRRKPGFYRVNLGCVDGIDTLNLPVVLADGVSF